VINALRLLAYPDVVSQTVGTTVAAGVDESPVQSKDLHHTGSKEASL